MRLTVLSACAFARFFAQGEMAMRYRIQVACIVAAVGSFVALSGNEAVARPIACTQEYAPVCAVKRGVARIYPNTCVAEASGAHIVRKSRCSRRPVKVRG